MKPTARLTAGESEGGLVQGWMRFWFQPVDPFGLHLLRVGTGLLLLAWLLPVAGEVPALFGLQGWFDRQAYVEAARLETDNLPKPISWSLLYLCGSNTNLLQGAYWTAIAVLVLFTLGIATRWTAPGAWLVVASFTANPLFDAEVDPLLQMLTLYLAVGYVLLGLWNGKLSWLERLFGSRDCLLLGRWFARPAGASQGSIAANVAIRFMQIHLAMVIVTTGLHKLQLGEWWSGVAHWYYLYPPLETTVAKAREKATEAQSFLSMLNIAAYATLVWQITFPWFAWRPGWGRVVLLGGAVIGWMGLAWIYRMPYFGPAFALGCLSYISDREWGLVGRALQKVAPLKRWSAMLPEASDTAWAGSSTGSLQAAKER